MGDQVFTVIQLVTHCTTLQANQAVKSSVWAQTACRAPWLGLEDHWPPCTETHWPEIWLKGQRPSYTTSFAAPDRNSSICSHFLRVILVSSSLIQPWIIHQLQEFNRTLAVVICFYYIFLVHNPSYIILIQVPLILQTLFNWPLWIVHFSMNTSVDLFPSLAGYEFDI